MSFIKYAEHVGASQIVISWASKNLTKEVDTETGEHIIDYLISDKAPARIVDATFEQMKANAEKWLKAQIKKGNGIIELPTDTEVVLDYGDGFKVVKLVGENAYKREGFLMSHCVASYYGKSVEIYSLRDSKNMPHCTMEKNQQIKGKGNGDIDPKYINYVVKFLEHIGMSVGDSEMKHLGYINIEKLLPELADNTADSLFNGKYFPINKGYELLKDKEGNQYLGMDLLDYFPMFIEEKTNTSFKLKLSFDMSLVAEYHKKVVKKLAGKILKTKGIIEKLEDSAKVSAGYSAKVSAGNSAKVSAGDYATVSAGYSATVSAGDSAKVSAGYYATVSAGTESKLDSGKNSILVGDNKCKAKGKLGTLLVLTLRDYKNNEWVITDYVAGLVDGKKIKEDQWYTIENGKFIETNVE